jgi:uncharacterized OB-fold protein
MNLKNWTNLDGGKCSVCGRLFFSGVYVNDIRYCNICGEKESKEGEKDGED